MIAVLPLLPGIAVAKTGLAPHATQLTISSSSMNQAVSIVLGLTLIAVIPGMLVAMTSFTRTIVVLSLLRHAIGMQDTPPNSVLVVLAAFLTLLSMSPTFDKLDQEVITPVTQQRLATPKALARGGDIMKEYMLSRVNETDMVFVLELSGKPLPDDAASIGLAHVVPAFLLGELRRAFQIGFVIFLPFLLVDLIVSSVLMSMGMMMVPPVSIALPIKILMFILMDGWTLVARAILSDGV
ncbi:flagellar biosynthetic protein FliP [Paludibacterium paludis]|uniref:Flagellar biosynthetic protein FliP n=1 Tax=Paludibacterium paludis TaxID=1225769 RepID=A0A918P621_9NEIS|nr:flagellar biosynthetic protein FliP [Paludibacterium paludis]